MPCLDNRLPLRLSDRRQCVRIRNSTSSWLPLPAGVPQGSVLGPLLFLAYTIDLPSCVRQPTQCDQFADDTALTTVTSSPRVCEEHLQQSVTATSTWLSNWRLTVNVEKTATMAFTRRPFPSKVSINLNGNALSTVNEHRHLGLILSSDLRWSAHIDKILSKAGRLLYTIIHLRRTLSRKALILYYSLYIRPVVEYACIAWPKLSAHLSNPLERFQRRAFKVILRKPLFEPSDHDEVLLTLQQPSLESRRQYQSAILGFQLANKTALQHLLNKCFPPASPARSLRQRNHFQLPTPHTTLYQSSPIYFAARTFNELPKHLQSIKNLSEFKRRAQQHFLSYSCPCSNHPNRSA